MAAPDRAVMTRALTRDARRISYAQAPKMAVEMGLPVVRFEILPTAASFSSIPTQRRVRSILILSTPGKRGAMRVNLKGVHKVRMKLKSGQKAVYYYAWRGAHGSTSSRVQRNSRGPSLPRSRIRPRLPTLPTIS